MLRKLRIIYLQKDKRWTPLNCSCDWLNSLMTSLVHCPIPPAPREGEGVEAERWCTSWHRWFLREFRRVLADLQGHLDVASSGTQVMAELPGHLPLSAPRTCLRSLSVRLLPGDVQR